MNQTIRRLREIMAQRKKQPTPQEIESMWNKSLASLAPFEEAFIKPPFQEMPKMPDFPSFATNTDEARGRMFADTGSSVSPLLEIMHTMNELKNRVESLEAEVKLLREPLTAAIHYANQKKP